jgi:hypothetical protein
MSFGRRRPAREPWKLGEPEEVLLQGITHRAGRWDNNQKLTDCGIHYTGHGTQETKERNLVESNVDCMACLVSEARP